MTLNSFRKTESQWRGEKVHLSLALCLPKKMVKGNTRCDNIKDTEAKLHFFRNEALSCWDAVHINTANVFKSTPYFFLCV